MRRRQGSLAMNSMLFFSISNVLSHGILYLSCNCFLSPIMQFSQVRPIRISIDKPSRRFRWKSDVKQQQENGNRRCNISHGNYLDGKIELPTLNGGGKYRLELALVPSQQSLFKAHPCLLHLTHPKTFQSLIEVCKENWKIAFELDMEKFELEKKHTQQLRIPLQMDQHGRVFISLGKWPL